MCSQPTACYLKWFMHSDNGYTASMMNTDCPNRRRDVLVIHCILHQCLCIDILYCGNDLCVNVLPAPNCLIYTTEAVCLLADMASCFWHSLLPYSVPVTLLSQWIMRMSFCMAVSVMMEYHEKENCYVNH